VSHVYPTPNPPQAKPPGATPTNHHPPLPKPAHTTVFMLLCRRVGGWEGGRMGVNEGGKGGGRERVCEKRVVGAHITLRAPPLAPVFRRAPVQHSIGRRVFRHMVV
jgi:hypothetical protein